MRPTWLVCALVAIGSAPAAAQEPSDPIEVCLASFKQAQVDRDGDRWHAAIDSLVECSRDACPLPVAEKCAVWKQELETAMPSLLLRVRDAGGQPIDGAVVRVDGQPDTHPAGAPIPLDPGTHAIAVETADDVQHASLTAVAGQSHELIVVVSQPARPALSAARKPEPDVVLPDPLPDRGPSPAMIGMLTAFGLSGALVIAGAVTGAIAVSRSDSLEPACASVEGCPQADIDAALAIAHASTACFIAAGVAAAAGVVALVVWRSEAGDVAVGPGAVRLAWRF